MSNCDTLTVSNWQATQASCSGSTADYSWFDRAIRAGVLKVLTEIAHGQIVIRDGLGEVVCGSASDDDLRCTLEIRDPGAYRSMMLGGSLGAAEAYLEGQWNCDDLTSFIRIMCRNLTRLDSVDWGIARMGTWLARMGHWLASNTRTGSRRNIAAHYDLSNELFQLFLDPSMMYSSAIFESPQQSLEDAQLGRLDRICRSLDLQPGDHLVEIGTGWGAMAIHAARHYGCRVTTTTISQQQYALAKERIEAAGLQDRITLLLTDYRDLEGQFDKLVSIEMIEAVGNQFLPTYFQTCDRLLKPGGRMLIQAITMPDQRYTAYLKSVDFIQKYIFPGGCCPSIGAMQAAASGRTDLRLTGLFEFAESYAETLKHWRDRFFARLSDVRKLGFDDRFIRMWDYYLCYCEGAFRERAVGVAQLTWDKVRHS